MRRPPVKVLLARLDQLWAAKRPALRKASRPPAMIAQLGLLEQEAAGARLPSAFRSFYLWHDGFRDEHLELEDFFGWWSIKEILKYYKRLGRIHRSGHFSDWFPGETWCPSWVPFLQFNVEDHVCLDLPGRLGKGRGAVFVRKGVEVDATRLVLAPSFHAWLHAHVEITAAGPDDEDQDEWVDFFASTKANRIRQRLDPGFPARVKPQALGT